MTTVPRVTSVQYMRGYTLELTFSTGEIGVVDYAGRVASFKGMMEPLRDKDYFARVQVDAETGTLVWPNGADVCPTLLYQLSTGKLIVEPERSATSQ
jgi:hypothetical protein